jgi:hypothetical protein
MQDSDEPRPTKVTSNAPILMILIAAAFIGGSFGIIVADPDALPVLRGRITWLTAGDTGAKHEMSSTDGSGLQTSHAPLSMVVRTGFSSIGSIRYTSQSDSTQLTFDLGAVDLIATGQLDKPDRVYIDLKENSRERSLPEQPTMYRTIKIDGDLVSRARIVREQSGKMRIVLDLNSSCEFTYETPPEETPRLIVKLRPRAVRASSSNPPQHKRTDLKTNLASAKYPIP